MSIWCEDKNSDSEHRSNRSPIKIDPITKVHIIHALDSGQSKEEIGRACGVSLRTIASIYKQKEAIIQKYKQKYNLKDGGGLLEKALLDWFHMEMKNEKIIYEEQLYKKAQEIIESSKNEFYCFDDWLQEFKVRHGISKYQSTIECSKHEKEEWIKVIDGEDLNNYYIGGFTALMYSQNIIDYLKGSNSSNYVAVFYVTNLLGTDKKPLAVIGIEELDRGTIKSIPVEYYQYNMPQVNYSTVVNYLNRWDDELKDLNKEIVLALNLPDNILSTIHLEHIKISAIDSDFFTKALEKLTEAFKYYYRKLQITRNPTFSGEIKLFDAIHIISLAWHSIPSRYILRLLYPQMEGSLMFKNSLFQNNEIYSLYDWCKLHDMPISSQYNPRAIDKFLHCEDNQKYLNMAQNLENTSMHLNETLGNSETPSSSGADAYQAMKRLVAFLQGEGAQQSTLQCAKTLEDFTEYGALIEIHNFMTANKNE